MQADVMTNRDEQDLTGITTLFQLLDLHFNSSSPGRLVEKLWAKKERHIYC
jgi:hypothetical protein